MTANLSLSEAAQSNKIKFNLTIHIEGDSLQEIDDGLMKAASQRLLARLESKGISTENLQKPAPLPNVASEVKAAINEIKEKKPAKVKTEIKNTTVPQVAPPVQPAPVVQTAPPQQATVALKEEVKPTKNDAIDALAKVNEVHGLDAARACVHSCGYKRVSEIPEDIYGEFIAHCNKIIG
jgi:hypothetical protein